LPLQDSNLALLIQSGDPRIRSSDKSLSNREFATSAVGKNDAIVGGCRGQRGQKRWHRRSSDNGSGECWPVPFSEIRQCCASTGALL